MLRQLMEQFQANKKEPIYGVQWLEKIYDRALRNLIWKALEAKRVSRLYIELVKDMYANAVTCVKTMMGKIEDFSVKVGLHLGSALSPYLFALMIDELSYNIQDKAPRCMLFVNGEVLIDFALRKSIE